MVIQHCDFDRYSASGVVRLAWVIQGLQLVVSKQSDSTGS